jgi:hypothetical protein
LARGELDLERLFECACGSKSNIEAPRDEEKKAEIFMGHSVERMHCYLGLIVNGDLAGVTIYTSRRGHVVMFPKAPPLNPPTISQLSNRAGFRQAAALWRQQTTATKRKWARAVQIAGLRVGGYNAFVSYVVKPQTGYVQTVEHQSGIQLLPIGS